MGKPKLFYIWVKMLKKFSQPLAFDSRQGCKMDFRFVGMDLSDNKIDFLSNSNMYSECAVRDKSNEMRMRGLHQLK